MLSLMSNKTKVKCAGIILLAFASALLASIWPVQLGEIYTAISDGTVRTIEDGALVVMLIVLP